LTISKNPKSQGFIIKTKQSNVEVTRSKILIGDFEISSPGEFDVSGTSCDVQSIDGHLNSLIESEFILMGALDAKISPDSLSEDYTKIAILLLFIDKPEDFKKGADLVGRLEPQLVFYTSSDEKSLSDNNFEKIGSSYKISKNDLVFEGTRHLVLE